MNCSKPVPLPSVAEEITNAVSHGIGALLSVGILPILVLCAEGTAATCGAILFGLSLIFLYLMSTLYHSFPNGAAKKVLQQMDHAAIFVLIAGSYSVFCLSRFYETIGPQLCIEVWSLAAIGILAQIIWGRKAHIFAQVLYLLMGWLVISHFHEVVATFTPAQFWFLLAGGLFYTVGFVFYAHQRIPWMHPTWHFFVLGGSVCHVICAMLIFL
ncbi:MAG: hemolysin III family protein [Thermoguttaceae bacterium]|nr:hemolysin III family protein [Thermoguttaceae bacterium]